MGTGTSSKTNDEEDVRNRLNSGDFQKISPPSSPFIQAKFDEMSYSGILVEKPETPAAAASAPSMSGASFVADLTTPPISNRSKGRKTAAFSSSSSSLKDQPRRIVKATPPPRSSEVVETTIQRKDDEDIDSPAHLLHAHASPIGANAAKGLLEESMEKNSSKKKSLERTTNKQKSDREKLLQEKRRRQQPLSNKIQANPFSRFLKAFSVDANPTHKRKESIDDTNDPNKRLKFGFLGDTTTTKPAASASGDNDDDDDEPDNKDEIPFYHSAPWLAAVSVATVAILVMAMVRGKKK